MDKLMDNPWFIKILALLLAVLLYTSVLNSDDKATSINIPGETSTATLEEVPVKAYYDTDNLVVTGIPETVEVTIKGPMPHVQSAKTLRNFEVFVDLTDAEIGNKKLKFEIRDLSDKVKATINPESVSVSIQEKVTKEFKVEAEFNTSMIEEGYAAGQATVEPNKVKITGAKNVVDQITYVKATIDNKDSINQTITQEAQVQVLDKELNKLAVLIEPETVKVTIPIKATNKTVPINVVEKGTTPDGIIIDSINLDIREAIITGDEEVLKETDNVRVEVDLSKITENTTLELPVIIPNGVTKVNPQTVKATVTVKKEEEEKTVSGIPINIRGLSEPYDAVINDPVNHTISLVINGPSGKVTGLNTEDFMIFIDLSGLAEGSHDVNIQVEGPPDVTWKPDKSSAKITISRDNV
jgi:YbbR domain-containing protein